MRTELLDKHEENHSGYGAGGNGQDNGSWVRKLLKILENPICKKVKPRILLEVGISQEMFLDMTAILEGEIVELETLEGKLSQKGIWSHERSEMHLR